MTCDGFSTAKGKAMAAHAATCCQTIKTYQGMELVLQPLPKILQVQEVLHSLFAFQLGDARILFDT